MVFLAYPPRFEDRVPDKTVTYAGENVTIRCVVSAAPAATVTWMKGNKTLNLNGGK